MRFLISGVFLFLASLPLVAQEAAKTPYWSSLGEGHHAKLNSGKPVILEEEIQGNPWPRFTIYQLVKATPAQVAAVFWDCEKDSEYIPNCTKVTILSHPSRNVVEAEYTLKMPFLIPDEVYVSRNEIRRTSDGGYEVSWKVLNSRYTKSCSGLLHLENHDGGTLIRYSNLVEPGSRIAKLLRASASRQVVESVQSLVDRIGELLIRPGNSLEKETRLMEEALGAAHPSGPAVR
jgi:ribosome-associated toxin RatA of RatAB toxin-antitoxin module